MLNTLNKQPVKVLLIEDDPDDIFLIQDILEDTRFLDCNVRSVNSYQEGLEEILKDEADIYLLDHHLGVRMGVELITIARSNGIKKPLILLTGNDSPEVDREAQEAGASDYILKSDISTSLLERSIRYALSQWEAIRAQEQLLREQLLREEAEYREAQWQLLSETIPYGLWLTNSEGEIEYISHSFLQLLGMGEEKLESLNFEELLPTNLKPIWHESLENGVRWNQEMELTDNNGSEVIVLSRGLPVINDVGDIEQWVGINLDVTREKKVEQRKDEFLRIASHELKSPIMSILSSLYIIEDEINSEQSNVASEYVSRMKRQLKNLTQLVEDLLDLSKIEMQKLSYYPEIICLNDVVTEVLEDLEPSNDHEIKVAMPDDIYLEADKQRIRQVFVNLLSNAIKYSPEEKKIDLTAEVSNSAVEVMITDYGIGIAPNELGKIFDKFYSSSEPKAKSVGGLGLGLFLTKKIVELHQGEINVSSTVGSGTTFTLRLPLKQED